MSTSTNTTAPYTANLSAPYPLSEVSNQTFSLTKNGHTFNFRMDIYSISKASLENSYSTMGFYLKERATIFLLGNNQGEEQVVAHYCHRYGPSSNSSAFYGYIVGQQEPSNDSFENSMFGQFTASIRTHFETNWDSSSLSGKSCIIV